jgi:hypothetical protein
MIVSKLIKLATAGLLALQLPFPETSLRRLV